jgi:hypothetical protein
MVTRVRGQRVKHGLIRLGKGSGAVEVWAHGVLPPSGAHPFPLRGLPSMARGGSAPPAMTGRSFHALRTRPTFSSTTPLP